MSNLAVISSPGHGCTHKNDGDTCQLNADDRLQCQQRDATILRRGDDELHPRTAVDGHFHDLQGRHRRVPGRLLVSRRLRRQRAVDRRAEPGQRSQQHDQLAAADSSCRRHHVPRRVRLHTTRQDAARPHRLGPRAGHGLRLHGAVRVGVRLQCTDDDSVDRDVGHHRSLRRRLQAVPGATAQSAARQDGLHGHRRRGDRVQHPAPVRARDPGHRRPVRRPRHQYKEDGAREQLDLLPRLQDDTLLHVPRLRAATDAHRAQHVAHASAARREEATGEADAEHPAPREHDSRTRHRRHGVLRVSDPRPDTPHHHDVRQAACHRPRPGAAALRQRRHQHAVDDQLVDELPRVLPHRQEVPQAPGPDVLRRREQGQRTLPDGSDAPQLVGEDGTRGDGSDKRQGGT